jgi:hypothetical protein
MHFIKFRQTFRAVAYALFAVICAALGPSLASGQSTAPWLTTATASNGVATWYVPNPNNVGIGTSILPSAPVNYTEFAIQGAWGTKLDMGGNGILEGTIQTDVAGGMFLTTVNTSFPLRFGVAGNENMRVDVTGNVGIGNPNPKAQLDVGGNVNVSGTLTAGSVVNPGSTSFTTTSAASTPQTAAFLAPSAPTGGWGTGPYLTVGVANSGNNSGTLQFVNSGNGSPSNFLGLGLYGTPSSLNVFAGSVGIGTGTATPHHTLSVNGTIGATEVVVTTAASADYVFGPGYRLAPLSEVSDYVKANHHLPEIPSAAEVAEKGVSVGEMQAKLLAKIEELTLHMIAAEKENRELKERLERLEAGNTNEGRRR